MMRRFMTLLPLFVLLLHLAVGQLFTGFNEHNLKVLNERNTEPTTAEPTRFTNSFHRNIVEGAFEVLLLS